MERSLKYILKEIPCPFHFREPIFVVCQFEFTRTRK
jgi:hypothetical protein